MTPSSIRRDWLSAVRVGIGVCVLAWLAACASKSDGVDEPGPDARDDSVKQWLPVAPTTDAFGAQGAQDLLTSADSSAPAMCSDANVAIAMWGESTCYAGVDGRLMCAGKLGEKNFGTEFSYAGIDGVVQILGSPGFWVDEHVVSSTCVLRQDGTAWCFGRGGDWGEFRTADGLEPGNTWKQWGTRSDIAELATMNLQTVCARYETGEADCVGLVCGYPTPLNGCQAHTTPLVIGTDARSLWIDGNMRPYINDETVMRAGNSVIGCVVEPEGLSCIGPEEIIIAAQKQGATQTEHGTVISKAIDAGRVVDGNAASNSSVCWLTADGRTWCLEWDESSELPDPSAELPLQEYFDGVRAIALAVNFYSGQPDRCVVADDGALWCVGGNDAGKLGSGSLDPLPDATQVQPPGSVRVGCGGGV